MTDPQTTDLTKCPKCGGDADNGHDRCLPPIPYFCTKCMEKEMKPGPQTTPDLALLRSALSRVLSAKDWAIKCGLPNVGSDLGMAGAEIRKFILSCPTKVKNDEAA